MLNYAKSFHVEVGCSQARHCVGRLLLANLQSPHLFNAFHLGSIGSASFLDTPFSASSLGLFLPYFQPFLSAD